MKRSFSININRSLEDTYDLLYICGSSILSWHKQTSNRENNYIEWKQSIWSLQGTAVIIARLKKVQEEETDITIDIIKPFQFMDPLNLCEKLFKKFDKHLQESIKSIEEKDK